MSELLYGIVGVITRLHNYFLTLNDKLEASLTDMPMHVLLSCAWVML